ncbi:protein kinase [Mycobacterium asiaticum]|uniref:Protein kinase n=2 Tax=Mycobacterium asiaticum TaxID=1790 RepID=A0A1A3MY68_MYCAS|nr:protein kinase [Mycobacterium asiaticum]
MGNPIVKQLSADGFEDAVQIGRGGFGVVYRCTQVELDRLVAVKILTIDLDENRPRFEREQRAMAKLTGHPNIAAVLQVGETYDGYPYLVMPFYRHDCLQTEIDRLGRLSAEDTLRVGVKIAGALESAHRLQIVHRDVKPANVMVTDYGEPALTDFGIAHMSGAFKTESGVFTGSPGFTAPELIQGEPPDPASDVYGLGATLYCALSGRDPYARRSGESVVAQLMRITTEPVPRLTDLDIDADADVAAVIHTALATNPQNRPSAAEFGEALQDLQTYLGLPADEMALRGTARPARTGARSAAQPSARRSRGNLPAPLAGFVGRQAELGELGGLLSTSRLVTLAGTGGVGKTTLALQAAREQVPLFDDGVWLVEFGDLSDGALLPGVAAAALGIHNRAATPLVDVMVENFADRAALVVFDNCEQVIDAAAQLIENLLEGCPRLRILATSREVLGIAGEAVLPLAPLSYPEADSVPNRSKLARYDAVTLFVERARAAAPRFTLTQHNAAAVVQICAQLDGLPLAIELAAARLRVMAVEHIADRLSDRLKLLTRGRRGAPARQQTLSMCIGWSYDRCTPQEQLLWARLSVFAGSFELDAAREICAHNMSSEDLLDELCALVDKSILIRQEVDGVVRFKLLATLREYGQARISTSEEYQRLQKNHLDWYQKLLAQAKAEFFSKHQVRWIHRIRREMTNLQEALQFAVGNAPSEVLEMATAMRHVWAATGMLQEERRWLELALSATPSDATPQRIDAFAALAMVANFQAEWSTAATCSMQARALLAVMPYPVAEGFVDCAEGFGALLRGEIEQAQTLFEYAMAITDDFQVQTLAMMMMSWRFSVAGDAQRALDWAEKALALAEPVHEAVNRSYVLGAVGISRLALGDVQTAERVLIEGLRLCRLTDAYWTGAQFLEGLAWVAAANHNPRRAVVLLAASAAVSRACGMGTTTIAFAGLFHEQCERQARQQLSASEFESASMEGDSLNFDEATAFALQET